MLLDSAVLNRHDRKKYHGFLAHKIFQIDFEKEIDWVNMKKFGGFLVCRVAECCSALTSLTLPDF